MKLQNIIKTTYLLSLILLCFISIVPCSFAEEAEKDLSKLVASSGGLEILKEFPQRAGETHDVRANETERDKISTYDLKVAFNERFKGFLSLGEHDLTDVAGRDIARNYHATVGVQIILP